MPNRAKTVTKMSLIASSAAFHSGSRGCVQHVHAGYREADGDDEAFRRVAKELRAAERGDVRAGRQEARLRDPGVDTASTEPTVIPGPSDAVIEATRCRSMRLIFV
jgi:hypothetical protein